MKKMILDLDTGVDDALAISYALGSPEIELICHILRRILTHRAFVEHSHILHLIHVFDWHNVILPYIKVKSYGRMTKIIAKQVTKTCSKQRNGQGGQIRYLFIGTDY